jgi:hypothetical protein
MFEAEITPGPWESRYDPNDLTYEIFSTRDDQAICMVIADDPFFYPDCEQNVEAITFLPMLLEMYKPAFKLYEVYSEKPESLNSIEFGLKEDIMAIIHSVMDIEDRLN